MNLEINRSQKMNHLWASAPIVWGSVTPPITRGLPSTNLCMSHPWPIRRAGSAAVLIFSREHRECRELPIAKASTKFHCNINNIRKSSCIHSRELFIMSLLWYSRSREDVWWVIDSVEEMTGLLSAAICQVAPCCACSNDDPTKYLTTVVTTYYSYYCS